MPLTPRNSDDYHAETQGHVEQIAQDCSPLFNLDHLAMFARDFSITPDLLSFQSLKAVFRATALLEEDEVNIAHEVNGDDHTLSAITGSLSDPFPDVSLTLPQFVKFLALLAFQCDIVLPEQRSGVTVSARSSRSYPCAGSGSSEHQGSTDGRLGIKGGAGENIDTIVTASRRCESSSAQERIKNLLIWMDCSGGKEKLLTRSRLTTSLVPFKATSSFGKTDIEMERMKYLSDNFRAKNVDRSPITNRM